MMTTQPSLTALSLLLLLSAVPHSHGHLNKTMEESEQCPTSFVLQVISGTDSCVCGESWNGMVLCDQSTNSSMLSSGSCMTYDETTNNTVVGACPFNHLKPDVNQEYTKLPQDVTELNEFMCGGLNRTGIQCSHCQPGLGPVVFSYTLQCTQCLDSGYGWLLYVFLATFPTTLLFFILMFFQIRITAAPLNAFIFICQTLVNLVNMDPYPVIQSASKPFSVILLTLYGVTNLDFFTYVIPPFCASKKLTTLQSLSLKYIEALYPILLIIVLYTCIQLHARGCRILIWLWRPFHRCCAGRTSAWNPMASLVHTFASFVLLSYSKILLVSCMSLRTSTLHYNYIPSHRTHQRMFYNASISNFGAEHLPFAVLAILTVFTFIIIPLLILLLYPTQSFHKFLDCCRIRWHALHIFADAFQGSYKDGTTGTPDWRYFAGFYLIFRIVVVITYVLPGNYMVLFRTLNFGIASLLFALLRPYKEYWINVWDSIALALYCFGELGIVYGRYIYHSCFTTTYGLIVIPLLYITLYITCQVLFRMGLCQRCSLLSQKLTTTQRATLPQIHNYHNGDSGSDDFPDRIMHPEQYEPLLSSAKRQGRGCEDGNEEHTSLRFDQETVPVYTYGSNY